MTHSDNFENYRSLLPLFSQIIGVQTHSHPRQLPQKSCIKKSKNKQIMSLKNENIIHHVRYIIANIVIDISVCEFLIHFRHCKER